MENRIDKYLWAVRIFKTRALAAEACKKGKVMILDMSVKPARTVKPGEVIKVKKMPVVYQYKVLEPLQKRVGAKLVELYLKDITPQEELDKLTMQDDFVIQRERGTGRPTKKDRRTLDKLKEE
ncbi:MAG: S4 domain-containing protein [Spirochaetales bacterium]|jgi:ribosome-associated heat shock protein Hsp15|nr:S4 domain-containing protein [Spirochaetales bacterium]